MARGGSNEITELLSETPGKLIILIDSVDWGNQEAHQLLECILEELKTKETTEGISKLLEAEGIKSIKKSNVTSNRLLSEVKTIKKGMSVLRQNTLNSRKQTVWQHYRTQQVYQIISQLLENDPPKVPRKFLSS